MKKFFIVVGLLLVIYLGIGIYLTRSLFFYETCTDCAAQPGKPTLGEVLFIKMPWLVTGSITGHY